MYLQTIKVVIKWNDFESHTFIVLSSEPYNIYSFEIIMTKASTSPKLLGPNGLWTKSVCAWKVAINWNVVEFQTFIEPFIDPDTIFSFEGIIANDVINNKYSKLEVACKYICRLNWFILKKIFSFFQIFIFWSWQYIFC